MDLNKVYKLLEKREAYQFWSKLRTFPSSRGYGEVNNRTSAPTAQHAMEVVEMPAENVMIDNLLPSITDEAQIESGEERQRSEETKLVKELERQAVKDCMMEDVLLLMEKNGS